MTLGQLSEKLQSGSCPLFLFSALAKVLSVHKVNA